MHSSAFYLMRENRGEFSQDRTLLLVHLQHGLGSIAEICPNLINILIKHVHGMHTAWCLY